MKRKFSTLRNLAIGLLCLAIASCSKNKDAVSDSNNDTVATSIKKYAEVWDGIINGKNLNLFNTTNFSKNVVFHSKPTDIVGIDSARAYYANYLTGFSSIKFTVTEIFGQGNKLTKHWIFSGVPTGNFLASPPQASLHQYKGQR